MPLAVDWTKKCTDDDDKTATEAAVRSAGGVLEILRELLQNKLDSIQRPTLEDYESPSWAAVEADRNGQRRTLLDLIKLVTIKD